MLKYESHELGISFVYPVNWILVHNCKAQYGADVLIHKDEQTFGIVKVSTKLNDILINNSNLIRETLNSSIQKNEIILEEPQINKYDIDKAYSATIKLSKPGNLKNKIQERTLVVNNSNTQCFIIAFEDHYQNYINGFSQSNLVELFNSFKFLR